MSPCPKACFTTAGDSALNFQLPLKIREGRESPEKRKYHMSSSCVNTENANRAISHHTPQAFHSVPSTSKVHIIKVASVREHLDMQTWLTQPAGQASD